MITLARLRLNLRNRGARLDAGNPYGIHAALCKCVADTAQARLLWRMERSDTGTVTVLVQAMADFDTDSLLDGVQPYCTAAEVRIMERHTIEAGERYRFRLTANPTVHRNGKRWALAGSADQLAWLARQAERHGFAVTDAMATGDAFLKGRPAVAGRPDIGFGTATFDGHLEVRDTDTFRQALERGIGPAKAFGCGLLSIAPSP